MTFQATRIIRADHPSLPGHFPGAPLVPGVVILDEVIAGYRFRAGDMGALYGVHPDLATFGKIMGGGFPCARGRPTRPNGRCLHF